MFRTSKGSIAVKVLCKIKILLVYKSTILKCYSFAVAESHEDSENEFSFLLRHCKLRDNSRKEPALSG